MKLNPDFILQQMPGDLSVLVPTGEAGERFRGVVHLNETAAFITARLQRPTTEEQLVAALSGEYEGTRESFEKSIRITLSELRKVGAIIE